MKVFYTSKQSIEQHINAFPEVIFPPSTDKPKLIADALKELDGIEFVEPNPLTIDDFKLCHAPEYVDNIFNLKETNGFGIKSEVFNESFKYTNGAMYDAAKAAKPDEPTAALCSGFHHSGFDGHKEFGYFCTFNGLMIAASKILLQDDYKKIAIIDCDQHYGNGTDNILRYLPPIADRVLHISFGFIFHTPNNAQEYLDWLALNGKVRSKLEKFIPDIILYQAGVDVHVNDPYGGVLTTEQMIERDTRMFSIAKELKIPLAWNLAGGYQSKEIVKELHLNTFLSAKKVYGI